MKRNAKLAETKDLVQKARDETSEGLVAKINAQEEVKNIKMEYRKLHKKCNEYRKISSEREVEIKKIKIELGKLKAQKVKETPEDERQKITAARSLLKGNQDLPQSNPIDTDNEEIEVDKEDKDKEDKDPEMDTDPDLVCSGWATNTGLTPVGTPKRGRKPIGRPEDQQTVTQYSSGSDSEGGKRKRNGVFKILRIP